MKTLIFDLWADWAHFRTFYTTTSPTTFSVIPPTAVFGLLGAVLGLDNQKNAYLQILNDAQTLVAVGLQAPVKKKRMGFNLINTKGNNWSLLHRRKGKDPFPPRTQIPTELLSNPKFRIAVSLGDPALQSELSQALREHRSAYTLCLGQAQHLANFEFIAEGEATPLAPAVEHPYHSLLLLRDLEPGGVCLEPGRALRKERLPCRMDDERIVQAYNECLFEAQAQPIKARLKSGGWTLGGFNFVWLT